MVRERILITVRTYPTFSKSYIETVCTGGITDQGEWRRLYPVSLRYEDEARQFKTFDIVEVTVRPGADGRLESRKPDTTTLQIKGHIDKWPGRCEWVNPTICSSIAAMASTNRSLAPVAVREIKDLVAVPSDPDWTPQQKEQLKQELMFGERLPLEKIPYDFRLRWVDQDGEEHDSLILAWEMYQTWRHYRQRYREAITEMRHKFMTDYFGPDRQVSLFMGNHSRFRETWMVCGWFHPPRGQATNGSLFRN